MIKKKKLLILIFIIFIFPINVQAECSYSEVSRLKKIASNLAIDYDLVTNNNDVYFDITINNLNKDIYILDSFSINVYHYSNNNELIIKNYQPGAKIIYKIYSNKNNCKDLELSTQYVNLPFYNKYYNDDFCKGIEDYSLCQKWTTHNITSYEEFAKKIKTYKDNLKKSDNIIVEDIKTKQGNLIIEFIAKNYIYIFVVNLLVISFVIYKKQRKYNLDFWGAGK